MSGDKVEGVRPLIPKLCAVACVYMMACIKFVKDIAICHANGQLSVMPGLVYIIPVAFL